MARTSTKFLNDRLVFFVGVLLLIHVDIADILLTISSSSYGG
jgi:hypothetical protein